ncbi:hypothetical protein KEM54_003428 [Ascosphaera aggregata]|nr:hypothetical protein KEM54_003428 [Ascosphaera aggregata]
MAIVLESTASRAASNGNVIVYLSPGPLYDPHLAKPSAQAYSHKDQDNDIMMQRTLAENAASTVVTLHYRLGQVPQEVAEEKLVGGKSNGGRRIIPFFRFPTPIHDTLAAFDWVLENLQPRLLGVAGTRIGGSLALMLALTEPRQVTATAAISPIGSWVDLDNWCITEITEKLGLYHKEIHASAVCPAELEYLLETRRRLFIKPDGYFDPFASPLLFLRSAGTDVPPSIPKYFTGPNYPIPRFKPQSKGATDVTDFAEMLDGDDESLIASDNEPRGLANHREGVMTTPFRKSIGTFTKWRTPWLEIQDLSDYEATYDGQFVLPYTRIYLPPAKAAPLLAAQGDELAHALRVSCFNRHDWKTAERVRIEHFDAGEDARGLADQDAARSVGQFLGSVFSTNCGSLPTK